MVNGNSSAGKQHTILALMSGTSVDTIDAAICRVAATAEGRLSCEVLAFHEHAMRAGLRDRIFTAFLDGPHSLSLACSLNFEIGDVFAEAAMEAIAHSQIDPGQISAIASHGQTLYHIAPHMAQPPGSQWVPSTLQVGESSVIASRTGLPVISNFRVADMAAGGNGAPLVPFADYHLFSQPGKGVVVHNLGGIGNCTWLAPSGLESDVLAFDTGPANMIIDGLVAHFYPGETYDDNGQHAANGKVIPVLLDAWMREPYIAAPPPKSTGRELFGLQFVHRAIAENPDARPDDLIATATEFTAVSLAKNLELHVMPRGRIDQLLVAGGGARNGFLMQRLKHALRKITGDVASLDDIAHSVTSKSRECAGFALMGYAHLAGLPANLPSVTGASGPAILGQYTPAPPRHK